MHLPILDRNEPYSDTIIIAFVITLLNTCISMGTGMSMMITLDIINTFTRKFNSFFKSIDPSSTCNNEPIDSMGHTVAASTFDAAVKVASITSAVATITHFGILANKKHIQANRGAQQFLREPLHESNEENIRMRFIAND